MMPDQPIVRIDVWSDYVCPFCYLALPALNKLQERMKTDGQPFQIKWRAFELRPEPNPTLDPAGDYLRTTWAKSVYPMAAEKGMTLKLPPVQPRSRLAHEAAAFADAQGRFDPMHEALFHAFFEDGRDIGKQEVLASIAGSAGIAPLALAESLQQKHFASVVEADQELAYQLGISGVPMMTLRVGESPWETALALQGAVPYEHMEAAVDAMLKRPSA